MEEVNIEDVVSQWKADSNLDETQINVEICKTPRLHGKYLSYFISLKHQLSKVETAYYKLGNMKRKYYRGECTQEDLKNFGWQQFQGLKPSNTEMNSHLEFDLDLCTFREKISNLKSNVQVLEYILKSIASRDYSTKTLFEYNRYINGN